LLNSDLPEEEKSTGRLTMEGRITVEGGTTTSALAISSICFHLLSNPEKLKILKEELSRAIPDQENLPTMAQVETLPYLVGHLCPCMKTY
jgi:cytochrome P450